MGILYFNVQWMLVNISLALVPAILTKLILKYRKTKFQYVLYFLWFIFLPNTIYTVTDLQYLPKQFFQTSGIILIIVLLQYTILAAAGVITYIYSMKPLELSLKKIKKNERRKIIIAVNFLIAFAIVIGKIQRTESWYLITDPGRVIKDTVITISSPPSLLFFITAGILINGFYFLTKKYYGKKNRLK